MLWMVSRFTLSVVSIGLFACHKMTFYQLGGSDHSILDTTAQLTEGRSARDQAKQPWAQKKDAYDDACFGFRRRVHLHRFGLSHESDDMKRQSANGYELLRQLTLEYSLRTRAEDLSLQSLFVNKSYVLSSSETSAVILSIRCHLTYRPWSCEVFQTDFDIADRCWCHGP